MSDIYFLLDSDTGDHEYTFTVTKDGDNTKYELKRSANPLWTKPNEIIRTFIDTGNGYIIEPLSLKTEDDNSSSYSDIETLFLLMDCIRKVDDNLYTNYELIKTENIKPKELYIKCPNCLGEGILLVGKESVNSLGEFGKGSPEIEGCKKCNGEGYVLYEGEENE